MTWKVIQWTTGHVGREAVKAIVAHPELELVGAYAWSPEKDGRDVGELCGIGPLGVRATSDVDALLAMGADCVCYTPNHPELDVVCRLLEGGVNVVASNLTNVRAAGDAARDRVEKAARAGGVSLFGSGIFPGFAIQGVMKLMRAADYLGLLPRSMIEPDPLFCSVFLANLGSVGYPAGYHHLWEYGTASIFGVMGKITPREGGRRKIDVCWTYDERIEDGLYSYLSLEMIRDRLNDPESLVPALAAEEG